MNRPQAESPLGRPASHEAARRHVTGEARYVDDLPAPAGLLVAMVLPSSVAAGRIRNLDLAPARQVPGVHGVFSSEDIPGHRHVGPIVQDEPLLAEGRVDYHGQAVALVVGESAEACRAGLKAIVLDIDPEPPIFTIAAAEAAERWHGNPHIIARGEVEEALAAAPVRIEAEAASGAQDHFYLETHAALVVPEEGGHYQVWSSTQHPSEVQREVAAVLGLAAHRVTTEVPRMGGGFGGKESQASQVACLAALGAHHTGRPVKLWLNREQDMGWTGKRHPFWSAYRAGFSAEGDLIALDVQIRANGGWTVDLSPAILDRALFHLDNAYHIPHLRFEGRVCRTNLPSNTAFRGFGGPQGMIVVEDAISRFCERTGADPIAVRRRNLYGEAPRDRTPYGQEVVENRLPRICAELIDPAELAARRAAIAAFNESHRHSRRGLAFQPLKFGISFTNAMLNQAGALVLIYSDGSVQLNHGGTEMGQGLHTKMVAVCAHELGIGVEQVRAMNTRTDKVPNTVATAASSGSDLNGAAVLDACSQLKERIARVAALELGLPPDQPMRFAAGRVSSAADPTCGLPFSTVTSACFVRQVGLAATGYYRTPGIAYNRDLGQGTPFHYFAFGGALVEVELSGLTGEHRLIRVDILHDVGNPLVPSIDLGQVEGAFVQGYGWLTGEEILFGPDGRCLTVGPSTYKIPAFGDIPLDWNVRLLDRAPNNRVVGGSKAVGEPPFMLAIGVVGALRQAIATFGPGGREVNLALPATPEAILRAVVAQQAT